MSVEIKEAFNDLGLTLSNEFDSLDMLFANFSERLSDIEEVLEKVGRLLIAIDNKLVNDQKPEPELKTKVTEIKFADLDHFIDHFLGKAFGLHRFGSPKASESSQEAS